MEVYQDGRGHYQLQSLVGFYGQHYFAFVRQRDDAWLRFDDASVRAWAPALSTEAASATVHP